MVTLRVAHPAGSGEKGSVGEVKVLVDVGGLGQDVGVVLRREQMHLYG